MWTVFETVKQAVTIRQVVEHYGCKVGRNGAFICPFHKDTHPSASIKGDFFNCFVCGAAGDSISFVARMFGIKNLEACKKIAEDFGIVIQTDKLTASQRLKMKRAEQKRKAQMMEQIGIEKEVKRVGLLLADWHREATDSIASGYVTYLYDYDKICHLVTEYDANPEGFVRRYRKEVRELERRLN